MSQARPARKPGLGSLVIVVVVPGCLLVNPPDPVRADPPNGSGGMSGAGAKRGGGAGTMSGGSIGNGGTGASSGASTSTGGAGSKGGNDSNGGMGGVAATTTNAGNHAGGTSGESGEGAVGAGGEAGESGGGAGGASGGNAGTGGASGGLDGGVGGANAGAGMQGGAGNPGGSSGQGGTAGQGGSGAQAGTGGQAGTGATGGAQGAGGGTTTPAREFAGWPMPNPPGTGLPHPQSYTDNLDGTVTDNVTLLVWQQGVSDNAGYGFSQADGIAYCDVNTAGLPGAGWRLPSLIELISLIDYTRASPTIDTTFFLNTPSFLWSSTTVPQVPSVGIGASFQDASVNQTAGTGQVPIRCVR